MCRTARALPAVVLAAAVLVISGPVASADPAAGAGRNTAGPGGAVTVPMPCDVLSGVLPGSPGAAGGQPCGDEQGQAQEQGQRQELEPEPMPAPPEAAGETGQAPQSAQEPSGQRQPPGPSQQPGAGQHTGQGQGQGEGQGQGQGEGQGQQPGQGQGEDRYQGQDEGGQECAQGSHGCPGGSGGTTQCHDGQKCSGDAGDAGDDEAGQCRDGGRCHGSGQECGASHGASCSDGPTCRASRDDDCGPPAVQGGVQAGQGGTFTDSVPALAAGGVLIAAACGGAGYRLYLRRPRRAVTG